MRVAILFALASAFGISEALRRHYKNINGVCYYYVVHGDTIQNVAADFCTSTNGLHGTFKVGNTITVPCTRPNNPRDCGTGSNFPNGYYEIINRDDETLGNIARDFCTSAENLVAINSGNSAISSKDAIFPGIIQVPCRFNYN